MTKREIKAAHREAIRERARDAIGRLYHNATVTYPRDVPDQYQDYFEGWFGETARWEIEYFQDGGAYGPDYRATLAAPCNAGKLKSEKARAYYIRKGLRDMNRERDTCARWERIGDYGTLYQWGRGGRTLAPDDLIYQRGGSAFSCREDYADEMPIASCVALIQTVESFNATVHAWCKSVPEIWREHFSEMLREKRRERKTAKREQKTTARKSRATKRANALGAFQPES
jgi:hypothetical protein